jgi:signal transduction histidine kinase
LPPAGNRLTCRRLSKAGSFVVKRLTIRGRILAFQLTAALLVAAMFTAGYLAYRNFSHYLARGALAHAQLDAVTNLARDADQYSEKISRFLTTGTTDRSEIARLQGRIAAEFDALDRATRREHAFLTDAGVPPPDESELARVMRLYDIYGELNARIEALIAMRAGGQTELASGVFYREIDGGLDDEFERLIAEAIADEMAEIQAADREAQALVRALGLAIGVGAVAAVLAAVLAAYFFYRAITAPIERLGEAAVAIGRGDLSARVGDAGSDELSLLARRFDEMAAQLQEQRRLVDAARSGLQAEVAARTAELSAANEALRDLDRSRVRFLADISHELRTPLTVLRGEAEVTLRGRADLEEHRAALRRIVGEAREMAGLVEDLMALARSESDDVRHAMEHLDLGEVLREAVEEARVLAFPRSVRIELAVEDGVCVEGDRRWMKRIAIILLDNAAKYAPRESRVALRLSDAAGEATLSVVNAVEDMDETELPHLFDRFYRGRAAGADSSGSGLGLAIARWMVEKQGGDISAARVGDDAIEVTVRFPAALVAAEEHAA